LSWLKIATIVLVLLGVSPSVLGDTPRDILLQLFPERIGVFRRNTVPTPAMAPDTPKQNTAVISGLAEYSQATNRFLVQIDRFNQDAQAYSEVTSLAAIARAQHPEVVLTSVYGTAGFRDADQLVFFRGAHLVRIFLRTKEAARVGDFAHALSDLLDKGEGEIPPLVKHLPNWEENQKRAVFLNRFSSLQYLAPNQTVLSVLDSGGDADATFVDTSSGKVLVVEYHTPQLAKDNDERIIAKIHDLWKLGQPAPIGYRRVGNYSVFVFDAPDDATAKQLIDQVKYEQVVQWLGDNPNILKEAERRYVETTLGVFIAVLKASGFALVACLGLGGLFGALLFSRRRSRQTALEAYSDAGGMLRLNIDEMTPQTDPTRLLGPGQKA
jgi:hypothetical protein